MRENEERTTQPLNFWENKFWHHKVHARLGETLYYYLVRVRPFDPEIILERMGRVMVKLRLGSVRVFPIFGQWDILIRAWLHPTVVQSFQSELNSELKDCIRSQHEFTASSIIRRWYEKDSKKIDYQLLENLSDNDFIDVQSGQKITLAKKLIDGEIVQVRDGTNNNNINFFIAVNLEFDGSAVYDDVISAFNQYLEVNPDVQNASIYKGHGFCRVLFKGQVSDYFNIAKLTNGVSKRFKSQGINTETFLLHGPTHLIGNEGVGQATFLGLKGVNLFVQSLIPELYTDNFPKRREVENFLVEEAKNKEFTSEDRKLINQYLYGFINNDVTHMQTTLYQYFANLERYLRTNLAKFIGVRTKKPVKEAYQKAKIEPSKKHLAIGDLLNLYSTVIKNTELDDEKNLSVQWEELANVRNQVAHGDEDFEKNWKEHLKILFSHLPRIHKLESIIENYNKEMG